MGAGQGMPKAMWSKALCNWGSCCWVAAPHLVQLFLKILHKCMQRSDGSFLFLLSPAG